MKKIYNKLVRDNIIDIIKNDGKDCKFRVLNEDEYLESLNNKLIEEHKEYNEDYSLEELADMQEVIDAILKARGVSLEEFNKLKNSKAIKRGGFEKRIFLIEVDEK